MLNFDEETLATIPGNTPKQKNENARFLLKIAMQIAYPRRGTMEEGKELEEFAQEIQAQFPNPADMDMF